MQEKREYDTALEYFGEGVRQGEVRVIGKDVGVGQCI